MEITQIYELVNSVTSQALGSTGLVATDLQGLIALGDTVLSSNTNTEPWLNTLCQRIGKTILSYRKYESPYAQLVLSDFEYGQIIQKIKVQMPTAENDPSYGLEDGKSVDMFTVNKPEVAQKIFTTETPYMFRVTIQQEYLKEAFLSESGMASFISSIFGEVENAIELAVERLGQSVICNMFAEVKDTPARAINLLKEYNTERGTTLTAANCQHDKDFMAFALTRIKYYSDMMTSLTKRYNDGSTERHTPKSLQRLYMLNDFINRTEGTVMYQAYQDEFLKLKGFRKVNFWQSIENESSIDVKRASDGTSVKMSGIIGCIFDRDSLGLYKMSRNVKTSPLNASGLYYNTFYHLKELYFNDLSENFVFFYIADDVKNDAEK